MKERKENLLYRKAVDADVLNYIFLKSFKSTVEGLKRCLYNRQNTTPKWKIVVWILTSLSSFFISLIYIIGLNKTVHCENAIIFTN